MARHEGDVGDTKLTCLQGDVLRHAGAEGIKLACRKMMCPGMRDADSDTKLACCKAIWLGTAVPKAKGMPKVTQNLHVVRQCG
ncbi:unnamed protein product [Prunus armeniaca]